MVAQPAWNWFNILFKRVITSIHKIKDHFCIIHIYECVDERTGQAQESVSTARDRLEFVKFLL